MSLVDLVEEIASGKQTATSLVERAFKKAEQYKDKNSLLSLNKSDALTRAKQIDKQIAAGEKLGRLAGVPFVAKDNMLSKGPTTAAAKMLDNFKPPMQAEVINRLEAEGAILIGKTNLDAFAHGGSTENSAYGATKHPTDDNRVPGGSSGGSAAAVALGITPFALGTDTGGSIRQPASFCGVVGLKPTYGAVSRWGVVAMASSTDVVGPITKTVADADLVMTIISGQDKKDAMTLVDYYNQPAQPKTSYKIGLVRQWFDGLDEAIKTKVERAVEQLEAAGHEVNHVDLPSLDNSLSAYYVIVPAEIASNLARYDGVRYGQRATTDNLPDMYRQTREVGFMPENKRRIMVGNFVLSSGYYDAYYKQAAKVRTLIINDFNNAFADHDFLLGSVASETAYKLGAYVKDPLAMYLSDLLTVPASLAGLPALSLPAGSIDKLPVGLQLIGPAKSDKELLEFAKTIEQKEVN